VAILFCQNNKREKFQITPFTAVNYVDSTLYEGSTKPFAKNDFYLLVGYKNHEENIAQIDSFVCCKSTEIDSILKIFTNYSMYFFKKSTITNNEHIKANERDFVRHSMQFDYLYSYQWNQNGFSGSHDKEYKHVVSELKCK
jgi:hypothetical protein